MCEIRKYSADLKRDRLAPEGELPRRYRETEGRNTVLERLGPRTAVDRSTLSPERSGRKRKISRLLAKSLMKLISRCKTEEQKFGYVSRPA